MQAKKSRSFTVRVSFWLSSYYSLSEASKDIMTKFKSQGLHNIIIKYQNTSGSGSTSSFIPAHWNIGILLHKQGKRRTIMHTTVIHKNIIQIDSNLCW